MPVEETVVIDNGQFPWPSAAARAAIVRTVQRWNRVLDGADDQGIKPYPAESAFAGMASPLTAGSEHELRTAAQRAQRVYPGAAGEMLCRELLAVADFGYGPIGGQDLITRLTDQILTAGPAPAGHVPPTALLVSGTDRSSVEPTSH